MARVLSVNVGMPREHGWRGRAVYTGAWKEPVDGARMVRGLGIEGDGQGDVYGHGGPNRALLVYQDESYDYWRRHFGRDDIRYGWLAENLTVHGLPDSEVCIGDRYRIGEAEFEVSQPRVTCFRAGLRIGQPEMAALLVAHHRPGFYFRVIEEGRVAAGDPVVRTRIGPGQVSVADADALLYLPHPDRETLRRAVAIPALSPGWQTSLRALLDADEHPAAAPSAPAWAGFRTVVVTDVLSESRNVKSFRLASADGTALPPAQPGQYLTVRVAAPDGGTVVRSYSLSGAPGEDSYRISVKREPGGLVSNLLHSTVQPGARLDVAAARGEFVLDAEGPVVLISAGVGITPVLAMLHQLAAMPNARPVWWLHAAHDGATLSFAAETQALLDKLGTVQAHTFLSTLDCPVATPGVAVRGRLTADVLAGLNLPLDAVGYICGPAGFMTDMADGLRAAGLADANIRTETFGVLGAINPGVVAEDRPAPHQPPGPPGTGPSVTFARSGITAAYDDTKRSLLEFAESCDIPTRWQCRTGVCRTCETGLLAGAAEYDPVPLDTPAPGTVLVCCARPETDVVLDM